MNTITIHHTKHFDVWLSSFKDIGVKGRIAGALDKLANGNFGDYKYISDGVWELLFHFGKGYRIYYGKVGNTIVILLCGGHKDSQHKDIEKAKQYLLDIKKNEVGK